MFDFSRENRSLLASCWRNIDKTILSLILLLFFLGLFFSFSSTSSVIGEKLNKESYFFFLKHFVFVVIALIIIFFISLQKREIIKTYLPYFFIISLLLLFLVPLIGIEIKGAKRWLNFFGLRFQPIEFIKPFFVLIVAQIIALKWIKNMNLSYFISFILLSAIVLLLILQPDLGQSILLICTWISLIFVSGVNVLFLFLLFIFVIFLFLILLYLAPEKFSYIITRITSFFDPTKADNSQSQKAIEAIKQGGLKGEGMGEGILKESVPEAHTDYIIAVISEEFGSIVSIFVISIFLFITFRIVKKIINSSNNLYKLSLCGLSSLLVFQTFIHVGVNANLLPTTGMTLPFLSYGGSSLLSSGVLAGVILNYTSLGVKN